MDEKDKTINELRRAVADLQEVWVDGEIYPEEGDAYLVLWEARYKKDRRSFCGPYYALIMFYPGAGWDYSDAMNECERRGYDIQIDYWRALEPPEKVMDALEDF